VCWHHKTRLESGPVTADLTTTVVHSYKLLINNDIPVHSLTLRGKLGFVQVLDIIDIFYGVS